MQNQIVVDDKKTENPCVPGSIPGLGTNENQRVTV